MKEDVDKGGEKREKEVRMEKNDRGRWEEREKDEERGK